jgi:methionyl aminopeptidase
MEIGLKEMLNRINGQTRRFLRIPYNNGARNYRTHPPVLKSSVSPRLSVPKGILYPEYAITGMPGDKGNNIYLYSKEEIPKLRKAARLARKMLEFALTLAKPGVTTDYIDRLTHEEIVKNGGYPSPLNYFRYPKSIATSVNEVACHGIPDNRQLLDGEIVAIDVSLYLDGFHGDNCGTTLVGKQDPELLKLIQVTKDCVQKGIDVCKPGA